LETLVKGVCSCAQCDVTYVGGSRIWGFCIVSKIGICVPELPCACVRVMCLHLGIVLTICEQESIYVLLHSVFGYLSLNESSSHVLMCENACVFVFEGCVLGCSCVFND